MGRLFFARSLNHLNQNYGREIDEMENDFREKI